MQRDVRLRINATWKLVYVGFSKVKIHGFPINAFFHRMNFLTHEEIAIPGGIPAVVWYLSNPSASTVARGLHLICGNDTLRSPTVPWVVLNHCIWKLVGREKNVILDNLLSGGWERDHNNKYRFACERKIMFSTWKMNLLKVKNTAVCIEVPHGEVWID